MVYAYLCNGFRGDSSVIVSSLTPSWRLIRAVSSIITRSPGMSRPPDWDMPVTINLARDMVLAINWISEFAFSNPMINQQLN
jgi:hypothetical protein